MFINFSFQRTKKRNGSHEYIVLIDGDDGCQRDNDSTQTTINTILGKAKQIANELLASHNKTLAEEQERDRIAKEEQEHQRKLAQYHQLQKELGLN